MSFDSKRGALHIIPAWSSSQKLVPGASAADEKSNEITALPELLDLLAIKGNQGSLRTDVELLFDEQMARDFKDIIIFRAKQTDAGHGRVETCEVFATADISWLKEPTTGRG